MSSPSGTLDRSPISTASPAQRLAWAAVVSRRLGRRHLPSPSGQSSTSARGYGSSVSHRTTRMRRVPTVTTANRPPSMRGDLQHLGDDADVGSRVAAADLAAAIDQHHTELVLGGIEAVTNQLLVPRLEHVQAADDAGQQHRAQREHRHDRHRSVSAAQASRRWDRSGTGRAPGRVGPTAACSCWRCIRPFCSSTNSIAPPPASRHVATERLGAELTRIAVGVQRAGLAVQLAGQRATAKTSNSVPPVAPATGMPCPTASVAEPCSSTARIAAHVSLLASERPDPSTRLTPAVGTPHVANLLHHDLQPGGARALTLGLEADLFQHHLGGVVVARRQHLGEDGRQRLRLHLGDRRRAGRRGPVEASPTAMPRAFNMSRSTDAAPSAGSFAATCGVCHESLASSASIGPAWVMWSAAAHVGAKNSSS